MNWTECNRTEWSIERSMNRKETGTFCWHLHVYHVTAVYRNNTAGQWSNLTRYARIIWNFEGGNLILIVNVTLIVQRFEKVREHWTSYETTCTCTCTCTVRTLYIPYGQCLLCSIVVLRGSIWFPDWTHVKLPYGQYVICSTVGLVEFNFLEIMLDSLPALPWCSWGYLTSTRVEGSCDLHTIGCCDCWHSMLCCRASLSFDTPRAALIHAVQYK